MSQTSPSPKRCRIEEVDDSSESSGSGESSGELVIPEAEQPQPESCSSECCSGELSEPYHPKVTTRRKQGKQTRTFQTTWYAEHNWLTFCPTQNRAFCYYCRIAVERELVTFRNKGHSTFASSGFNNWKKGKERFREHERSQLHLESCMKIQSLQKPSIAVRLSTQLANDQKQRREMLMKELTSIKYLVRQGLAI